MIEKIEVSGNDYKVEEPLKRYVEKRFGKLDRYLPKGFKKDVVLKVIVAAIGKSKGEKYELSVAMEIPGGKVLAARDECSNVFAGVDLLEAKLTGQIRRYKLEVQPHRQKRGMKRGFKKLFRKRK